MSGEEERGLSSGAMEEGNTEKVRLGISELTAKVKGMMELTEAEDLARVRVVDALGLATSAIGMAGMLIDILSTIRKELTVSFTYNNHRGVVERRTVRVLGLRFGSSVHYKEEQWLLRAWCYDRKAERDFALSKITDYPG